MKNNHQESQQSGSRNNEEKQPRFGGEFNSNDRGLNQIMQTYGETDGDKDEYDIGKRVNVLKDVSINLNTEMDDDINTLDKDSAAVFTGNEMNQTLGDMKQASRAQHDLGGGRENADGPNPARNMGFPNMKYLDADAVGAPIQEKTLYKEFQQNKDNDIRRQREGFSNAHQDMANNTFIKLF